MNLDFSIYQLINDIEIISKNKDKCHNNKLESGKKTILIIKSVITIIMYIYVIYMLIIGKFSGRMIALNIGLLASIGPLPSIIFLPLIKNNTIIF
jgi:hypothetical protein